MAIGTDVRPAPSPRSATEESRESAAVIGRWALRSRLRRWAKPYIVESRPYEVGEHVRDAWQLQARRFILREVREARSRAAAQLDALYGSAPEYERHRSVVLVKAARIEARRAAPGIAAFRCVLAATAGFFVERILWHRQHALCEALGMLAFGACVIASMAILMRSAPTRFTQNWAFALLLTGYAVLCFVISAPVSIWEFYFTGPGHPSLRYVHFLSPSGSLLSMCAELTAFFGVAGVAVGLSTAREDTPGRLSPLDETFFAVIGAACEINKLVSRNNWSHDGLARSAQQHLESAARAAEKAFMQRGTRVTRNTSAYTAGRSLGRRIRAHTAPIAKASSKQQCAEVYAALMADIDAWINEEPFVLEDADQEETRPPKLHRLRRVLRALATPAVLVAAGFLVPLVPGLASDHTLVDSARVYMWGAAVLSVTVGGVDPSDLIMSFLRGSKGK